MRIIEIVYKVPYISLAKKSELENSNYNLINMNGNILVPIKEDFLKHKTSISKILNSPIEEFKIFYEYSHNQSNIIEEISTYIDGPLIHSNFFVQRYYSTIVSEFLNRNLKEWYNEQRIREENTKLLLKNLKLRNIEDLHWYNIDEYMDELLDKSRVLNISFKKGYSTLLFSDSLFWVLKNTTKHLVLSIDNNNNTFSLYKVQA